MRGIRNGLLATIFFGGLLSSAAQSQTVNTYSFSQSGYWFNNGPETLSGTFTVNVNPLGESDLGDLTAFSAGFGGSTDETLADLTLFSFNTDLNSGLAFVGHDRNIISFCVGLPTNYEAFCNPGTSNPINTFGFYGIPGPGFYALSDQAPVIRLVTSVTTDPRPNGVPEPATWAMMLLGFAGIGLAARCGQNRTPAQAA